MKIKITLFFVPFFLFACTDPNATSQKSATTTTTTDTSTVNPTSASPDAGDLLSLLQGQWQSDHDSTYYIVFVADTLRHINAGKLSEQTLVEINGNCQNLACKNVVTGNDGWCFVEKSPNVTQCNMVVSCNPKVLRYRSTDAAGGDLVFYKK